MCKNFLFVGLFVIVLLLECGTLFAQATASAALQGTVMDTTKAILPGASVTLTNRYSDE